MGIVNNIENHEYTGQLCTPPWARMSAKHEQPQPWNASVADIGRLWGVGGRQAGEPSAPPHRILVDPATQLLCAELIISPELLVS